MVAEKQPKTEGDCPDGVKRAVAAYAQSEKVKSGLIWICQIAEQAAAVEGPGRQQAVQILETLARLVADESQLAEKVTGDRRWHEIGEKINMALVMIRSGVPQETGFHLTRAISRVTRIGGQAASILRGRGFF